MQQSARNMVATGGRYRFAGLCVMKFHKFRQLYVAQRIRKKFLTCWRIATITKFLSRLLVGEAEYAAQPSPSLVELLST
jgi:hypothetical protein